MSQNIVLVERKACFYVENAFLGRSELNWPISRLENSEMSKRCVFGKKLQESMG